MEIIRIKTTDLSVKRLDSGYYRSDFLRVSKLIENSLKKMTLEEIRDTAIPIRRGIDMPKIVKDSNAPKLITIAAFQEPNIDFENLESLDLQQHNAFRSSQVKSGDLLIAMGGYAGYAAICQSNCPPANIGRHTAKVVVDEKKADKYFLWTFIRSKIGTLQFSRAITGSVQAGINLEDLREIAIPIPHKKAQAYIGEKVRQAERLRQRARELEATIKIVMLACFCGDAKPQIVKHNRIGLDSLTSKRMEPEFYGALELWSDAEIKGTKWRYKPLSELATRIKDGPGGWGVSTNDYTESGVPVIRGVNLVNGVCDLTDCVFISEEKHRQLNSHRVNENSVLLSVRGTIGRTAVFAGTDYDEANLNAAVVTIDCTDEINPHFLAEFIHTEIGNIQCNRIANGGVQLNMNLTETGSNLIVIPPPEFQEQIAEQRQKRMFLSESSKHLTTCAKYLVEGLIEGKITENELVEAEEGLEAGEREADKQILARVTRQGMDAAHEPALFGDVDALYDALAKTDDVPIEIVQ